MSDNVFLSSDHQKGKTEETPKIRRFAPAPMRRTSWRRSDDGRILEGIIDFKHETFVTTESLAGAANLVTMRRVTEEYKFWDTFFHMISSVHDDLQTKFRRRVDSTEMESGLIYWDFWAGRQSYIYALDKAIKRVEMDWKFSWEKTEILLKLAHSVIETRRCELKPSSPSYHKHLNVYNKWILLGKILADKQPASPIVEFILTLTLAITSLFVAGTKTNQLKEEKSVWEAVSSGIGIVVKIFQYVVLGLVGFFMLTAVMHVLLILIPPAK